MYAGTLRGKACKNCGEIFRRGAENKIKEDYCASCSVKGWQKEMYELGCNVIHPKNMGKIAHVVPVKLKDCPKVIINGLAYRDTTAMLFEDTKYEKQYLTRKQQEKVDKYQRRKVGAELRKEGERGTKIGFKYTDKAIERMVEMARAGESDLAIAKAVGTNRRSVYMKLRDLRKQGVEC